MAISFDDATSAAANSQSSLTFAHPVASQSNGLLIVSVSHVTSDSISSVTYAGVAMTLVDSASNGSGGTGRVLSMYRLIAPATGSNNVVVTLAAASIFAVSAQSFYGVDQTTPLGTAAKTNGSGTSASVSPGSAVGDVVVDGLSVRHSLSDPSATASQTVDELLVAATNVYLGAAHKAGASPSTTMSWSWTTADNYALVAVALKPFTGAQTISPGGSITPAGSLLVLSTIELSGAASLVGTLANNKFSFLDNDGDIALAGDLATLQAISTAGIITSTGSLDAIHSLDFNFQGSGDIEIEGAAQSSVFLPLRPALSHAIIYSPDGTQLTGELTPLKYKISRYQNRVGSWSLEVPVHELVDSAAAAVTIGANYKVSIYQDENNPFNSTESGYLLYQGVVETREHRIRAGGQSTLALTGSFRTLALVRRSVRRNFTFDGSLTALTNTLVSSNLGGDTAVVPAAAASVHVKGEFNDLSRYAAWVKGLTLGRHAVREGWDHDRPEITSYDGPPNPGVIIRQLFEDEDRYQHATGTTNIGLIAGEPAIRFDGTALVNRVIAYGVDTVADPEGDPGDTMEDVLTLDDATLTAPYVVQSGLDEGGNTFFYIEDSESVARYGLVEVTKVWTDIKNPNDDSVSRGKAANVLYMTAVNELIKRRSEKNSFTIGPIANGARIWSLPGDQVWAKYQGAVETEDGDVTWINLERRFLVTERHDTSDPSGIRRVEFVLTAPEMEFPVPGLPEVINPLDPEGPTVPEISFPPFPEFPEMPGLPPMDGAPPVGEPCCADPTTSKDEGPEEDFSEHFPDTFPSEPPPPSSESQEWDFVYGGGISSSGTSWAAFAAGSAQAKPGDKYVLLVIDRSENNRGIEGTDCAFTLLTTDSFSSGPVGGGFSGSLSTTHIKVWLVEKDGPNPSWNIVGGAGAENNGAWAVARCRTTEVIASGDVTVETTSGVDTTSVDMSMDWDITLEASASLEATDNKDLIVAFAAFGGTEVGFGGAIGLMLGDSISTSLPYANIGPTDMPAHAAIHSWHNVPPSYPGATNTYVVFVRTYKLHLP